MKGDWGKVGRRQDKGNEQRKQRSGTEKGAEITSSGFTRRGVHLLITEKKKKNWPGQKGVWGKWNRGGHMGEIRSFTQAY